MSFDLHQDEIDEKLDSLPLVEDAEPGFFEGMKWTGPLAMRTLASTARAVHQLGSVVPMSIDKVAGTDLTTRHMEIHEDVYQRAVDYWTPRPNEVGTAAQIMGDLLVTLPMAITMPPLALANIQTGTAEELVRQGVEPGKAQAAGGVQSAGFALGIWMPILGRNLWERTLVGGAGFNLLQGAVTRGVSGEILEGTPAEGQFKAFDGTALTLDVLMGMGFGSFSHLNPESRRQGAEMWNKIQAWAEKLTPTQKAAIATLRESQHLNVDSVPGKPREPIDVENHVNKVKRAMDQLLAGEPVNVEDMPAAKIDPDPMREQENLDRLNELRATAEQVRQDEGLPPLGQAGRTVTERLMDIGIPAREAADKGLLWDSFFKVMGERTNIHPEALMERYFGGISKGTEPRAGEMLGFQGTRHQPTPEAISEVFDYHAATLEMAQYEANKLRAALSGDGLAAIERNQVEFKLLNLEEKIQRAKEGGNPFGSPDATYAKHVGVSGGNKGRKFTVTRKEKAKLDYSKYIITRALDDAGIEYKQADNSQLSESQYLILSDGRKIRISDHTLPRVFEQKHGKPDFDVKSLLEAKDVAMQIRGMSAIGNRGTFDPNDPNILNQENRGYIEFGPSGKMSIGLLQNADRSTFLHESGHFFLEVMTDLARGEVPELKSDMDAVYRWLGVKDADTWADMTIDQRRPYHEQWARGFEQYLREGKAPSPELKSAFGRFRDWLIEIYRSATQLNVTLSDEVRGVMDRMLASQKAQPTEAPQAPTGGAEFPPRGVAGEAPAAVSARPLDHPDIRAELESMASTETGWDQVGGRLIRSQDAEGREVISRTQWIPRAEWWMDRPTIGDPRYGKRLSEPQVIEAVRKHLAGEALNKNEKILIDFMGKVANDRLDAIQQFGEQEFGATMQDAVDEGLIPTTETVFDSQTIARAMELNPEAANMAMEAYNVHDDDATFMAQIRSIIDDNQKSAGADQGGAADTGAPAKQADPVRAEAERIVAANPERAITIGRDPDGKPITTTFKQFMEDARAEAQQGRDDANLFQVAAECLLGSL